MTSLCTGDRSQAEAFYIDFLGLTSDPSPSFHVNLGMQQFHLQLDAPAMRISGVVGLALPSLDTIRARKGNAATALKGTEFTILHDVPESMLVRCPWGNVFLCMPMSPAAAAPTVVPPPPKLVAMQTDLDRGMGVVGGARAPL